MSPNSACRPCGAVGEWCHTPFVGSLCQKKAGVDTGQRVGIGAGGWSWGWGRRAARNESERQKALARFSVLQLRGGWIRSGGFRSVGSVGGGRWEAVDGVGDRHGTCFAVSLFFSVLAVSLVVGCAISRDEVGSLQGAGLEHAEMEQDKARWSRNSRLGMPRADLGSWVLAWLWLLGLACLIAGRVACHCVC